MKRPEERLMRDGGFTLMEVLTVMVMIGVIVSIAIPKMGTTIERQQVRGVRSTIATMHSRTRNLAISRGRNAAFLIKSGILFIRTKNAADSTVVETLGLDSVTTRLGVELTITPSGRDSLTFDSRGLGLESDTTAIIVAKSGYADTMVVSKFGRIYH